MGALKEGSIEELEYYIGNSKSLIRQLNLMKIDGSLDIKIGVVNRKQYKNIVNYLYKRKTINKVLKSDAILTGSKSLSLVTINGLDVIRRDVSYSDWDFLTTEKNLYNVSKNLEKPKKTTASKLTFRISDSDSYGSGGVDMDLIVKSEETPFIINSQGYRISDPIYIIGEKIKLVESYLNKSRDRFFNKHFEDIKDFSLLFQHLDI